MSEEKVMNPAAEAEEEEERLHEHHNFMTSWRWSMNLGDWCVERAKRRLGNDTDLRRNTASTCPRNVLQRKRSWTTLTKL